MGNKKESPGQKAKRTGKWAKIMTKWLITYSTKGRKKWQIVSFEGAGGSESRGIVDFIAIRRNHKSKETSLKIGDLFEIILFQVKGGSARMPTAAERIRLTKVKKHYKAKQVILATWKKGKTLTLQSLEKYEWGDPLDSKELFK
ncbi:MAG: hypothetical protein IPK90_08140 [Chitinophagaceae bacterium]|nr:hypothetical protein [Chitinophagaceae bacterium]